MSKTLTKKRGFTLIEIMLYLAISAIVAFAIMSFALQIIGINKKTADIQEIQASMDYAGNKLSYTIQSSSSIDDAGSIFGNYSGKLSLNVVSPTKTPTSIYLENENIYLKEGSSDPAKINSDFVKCTQLKFIKVVASKAPDQIVVDMQCEPINSDLAVSRQSFSLHTSISLRK